MTQKYFYSTYYNPYFVFQINFPTFKKKFQKGDFDFCNYEWMRKC